MHVERFEPFADAHWAALIGLMIAVCAVLLFRSRLRDSRVNRRVRIIIALVLGASELSLHVWYALTDGWGIDTLPFQLCSIMVWLSAAALLTRVHKLYDAVFFLGLLGALQAMLTPNLDYGFPHFRYFHFFIAHIAIISASLFLLLVERYRPTFGSVMRALLWLHVLAIPAAITNMAAGTNFMFLARKPSTPSLLDLLAPWPWYLLQLEAVALG